MSAEREAMLTRIRQSLKTAVLPQAIAKIPAREVSSVPTDAQALIESFTRELQAVGGGAHQPASPEAARAQVVQLIKETGSDEVLAWPDEELPLPDIGETLRTANIRRIAVALSSNPGERRLQMADLDRPLVGLTGALGDLGSLALLSGPTRSRAASLMPLVHIALLPIQRLYPTTAAFLAVHPDLTRDASNLVFITGPSRTADIEMVITRGVHGPKTLHVILWPNQQVQ